MKGRLSKLFFVLIVFGLGLTSCGGQGNTGLTDSAGSQSKTISESEYEKYLKNNPNYAGTEEDFINDSASNNLDKKLRITLDLNGGTGTTFFYTKYRNFYKDIPEPCKDFFVFNGWLLNGSSINVNTYVFIEEIALKANWIPGKQYYYDNFEYITNDDGDLEITKYLGNDNKVYFPLSIDGKDVVSIRKGVLKNHTNITSISLPAVSSKLINIFGGVEQYIPNNIFINLYPSKVCNKTSFLIDGLFSEIIFTSYNINLLGNWSSSFVYFKGCIRLNSIIISGYVTNIIESAFHGCSTLTSITIPNSVTSIGNNAFNNCGSLASISIPNSVTDIGERAFQACSRLTSIIIPDSVISIGEGTFYYCTSLSFVALSNSLTRISGLLFAQCSALSSIIIPNSVTIIDSSAFLSCGRLKSISLPDSLISIGNSAFRDCLNLTSISLPNTLTSIGNGVFEGCVSLASINFPNLITSISDNLFYNCWELTSLSLPDSITSIGRYAFSACWKLALISLPNTLTSIGDGAFSNCTSLTSIYIPSSVEYIGHGAMGDSHVKLTIYCECESQPASWEDDWAVNDVNIVWGYKNI